MYSVLKENEFTGEQFDKKNILAFDLLMQKGLIRMRMLVDITPAYAENGNETLTMYKK